MKAEIKIKLKKIAGRLFWITFSAGFSYLLIAAMQMSDQQKCKAVNIQIDGQSDNFFIEKTDIRRLIIQDPTINPIGQPIYRINLRLLEQTVQRNPWVKTAQLYIDNLGQLHIHICQRDPLVRVFTVTGNSFYIDTDGQRIPVSDKFTARVPVFTNFPADSRILKGKDSALYAQIVAVGKYLQQNNFWMAQIDQIDITPTRKLEMIPKLGDQVIEFGEGTAIGKKFDKLLAFYRQGMGRNGWNDYSRINVAFENQIVCTRRNGPLKSTVQPTLLSGTDSTHTNHLPVLAGQSEAAAPAVRMNTGAAVLKTTTAQSPVQPSGDTGTTHATTPKVIYTGTTLMNTTKNNINHE